MEIPLKWSKLAKIQNMKAVKSMYIWLLIVPILARALSNLEGNASRAGEKQNPKNELLEAKDDGEWLDTGKTSKTGGNDPELETVGMLNRAKN